MDRKELLERFWDRMEPDIHAYSRMIDRLLSMLTDAQLQEFVGPVEDDEIELPCAVCGVETNLVCHNHPQIVVCTNCPCPECGSHGGGED